MKKIMQNLLRWVPAGLVPLAAVASMSIVGSAGTTGQQLIAHAPTAYSHCTTGNNQDGVRTSHCFATPGLVTAEPGWWWQWQIDEGWFGFSGEWLCNSGDNIIPNPFSDWNDVYQPSSACP